MAIVAKHTVSNQSGALSNFTLYSPLTNGNDYCIHVRGVDLAGGAYAWAANVQWTDASGSQYYSINNNQPFVALPVHVSSGNITVTDGGTDSGASWNMYFSVDELALL